MVLRGLIRPRWMLGSVVILLVALGVACGDDAAPAPTVDVNAIAGQVQKALKQTVEQAVAAAVPEGVSAADIAAMVQQAVAAAPAGATAAEIAKLVETAVMEAVPEGTTPEEIAAMVKAAVTASVPEGPSAAEIASLVESAVGEAVAKIPAAEVPEIDTAAIQAAVSAAVADAVPEGTSAEDIEALVVKAVKAAVTPGVTTEEIEAIVKRAVATPVPVPTAEPAPRDAGFLVAPEGNAKYGGVLKQGAWVNASFFDLHQTSTAGNLWPQTPMYDLLVQLDPFTWDNIIPDLATSWTVSDDGLTYSFNIRENVKFHDGALLTAEDVVASFNHIIFPPEGVLSPRKGLFDAVTEVVASGPMEVEFRLREARGFMLRAIAIGTNVIVRKQTLEDNDFDLGLIEDYPGTGPFIHDSFEPAISWKVERNPNYWNPDLPYLDRVDTFATGFGAGTGTACIANNVDFCNFIDPESFRIAGEHIRMERSALVPTTEYGMWMNYAFELPDGRKPFADVRVRRAINLVLDKPALNEIASEFVDAIMAGWITPSDPLWDEWWATAKDQPGWRSPTAEDIELAKSLMVEAGYADGFGGVDFMVRNSVPWWVAWSPVIQDVLKRQLKIESKLRSIATGAFFVDIERGNFDMVIPGLNSQIPHVADYWANWYMTDGGYNKYGYSNPEFDAILAKAASEGDPQKLKELKLQGAAILQEDVPLIVIGSNNALWAWWDYVKGHGTATRGGNVWEGNRKETMWLDK